MSEIVKHSFEAVSLLTTSNGMLDVTVIAAVDQPDWIVPTSLILDIEDSTEQIGTHVWQQQQLPVFHLFLRAQTPSKMIVIEGNTSEQRIALQSVDTPHALQVRISDVKDVDLPEHYATSMSDIQQNESHSTHNIDDVSAFWYQAVMIDNIVYLIPDVDKLAHHLIES